MSYKKGLIINLLKLWGIFLILMFAIPFTIYIHFHKKIYSKVINIPNNKYPVAIIFGAGIYENKYPGRALTARLETTLKLYKMHKVKKILISGDNSTHNHSEPDVMYTYLTTQGVAPTDIFMDYAGFNTYHTCLRAKHIFKIDKAILISQEFHLTRALYLCQNVNIETIGVSATNPFSYTLIDIYYNLREILAIYKAVIYAIIKPSIIGGPTIPINSN